MCGCSRACRACPGRAGRVSRVCPACVPRASRAACPCADSGKAEGTHTIRGRLGHIIRKMRKTQQINPKAAMTTNRASQTSARRMRASFMCIQCRTHPKIRDISQSTHWNVRGVRKSCTSRQTKDRNKPDQPNPKKPKNCKHTENNKR